MQLLNLTQKITPKQDKTNITHCFTVPAGVSKITIKYTYSPRVLEDDELGLKLLCECYKKYNEPLPENLKSQLPVRNVITISVDDTNGYRGGAHHHNENQTHIISEHNSTYGFNNGKIEPGVWDVMVNVHCIICDVVYSIEIYAE